MQATEQAMAQQALELRILSGLHQGARMPATAGMTIGVAEQADAILSDLPATATLLRLELQSPHAWRLNNVDPASAEEDSAELVRWHALGQAHAYGGIWVCVAQPHQEWPKVEPEKLPPEWLETAPEPIYDRSPMDWNHAPDEIINTVPESSIPSSGQECATLAAATPMTNPKPATKGRMRLLILAIITVFVLGLFFNHTRVNQAQAIPAMPTPQDLLIRANGQLPALQLAIAQVDPALRLELAAQPDGRVQIAGWVASIEALDRLSTAMARQHPAPLMRVRTISEMRTDLKAMLPETIKHLEFNAADACCLRMSGIVPNQTARQEAIEQTEALLPPDLKLQNSLRLAETMPEDVAAALRAEGFADVTAHWDGQQIIASVPLSNQQRARLENALLAIIKRWPGMPLKVVTEVTSNHHSRAPFEIRSVVGGTSPYLVLPGGSKLLPGASHAGWRLQAIEDHAIVFDQPRRITVAR